LHAEIARVKQLLATQQTQTKTGPARITDRVVGSPGLGNYRLPVSPSPRSKFGLSNSPKSKGPAVGVSAGAAGLMPVTEQRSDDYTAAPQAEGGGDTLTVEAANVPRQTRHDFEPARTVRKKKTKNFDDD